MPKKGKFFHKTILSCLVIVFVIISIPKSALASTTYDLSSDISLGLTPYTQGPSGFAADNLIRIGKTETIAKIQADVVLGKPAAGISIGADQINGGAIGPLKIMAVGAGLDQAGSNGGGSCTTATTGSGGQVFSYTTCSFKDSNAVRGGTFAATTPTKVDIDLTLSNYHLDPNNLTSPQQIVIYPYLGIEQKDNVNPIVAFPNGGMFLYVQFYNTQADADTAIAANTRPSGVPAFAGATTPATSGGSFQQTKGLDPVNALMGFLTYVVNFVLGLGQEIIYFVFFYLIAPIIQAMLSIHPYTDSFVAIIYPGWEITRNLCNMLFILALVIIGLATLFRIESYQYRHLLVQVIIAALLINFSLVIGQAILGFADTIQAQFLPANVTVIRSLAGDLMVKNWRSALYDTSVFNSYTSAFNGLVAPFVYLSLSLGAFCVFLAIAAFLVIRIVALWILLLIAPVAYACGVLPSMASYRSKWWQEFLKYAFFTPIMAFFLNMTAIISDVQRNNPILNSISDQSLQNDFGGSALAYFVIKITSNILLLIFLIAALKVAELAGVYGAAGITKFAQSGIGAPFAGAGWLAKAGGLKVKKEYDKRTSGWANADGWRRQAFKLAHAPSFVKGLRAESQKERELYGERVQAGATQVARKQLGWRRKTESPMFIFDEHKGKEVFEEEEGEWSDNEQQMIAVGNRLAEDAKKGDLRAQIKLKHWFKEAFRHRNLNEALEGDNGMAAKYLGGKLNYNSNNIRYFFQKMSEEGYIDKNFAGEFLKKLSKDGYETGDFNGVELVYSGPDGHPHMIEMDAPVKGNSLPKGWATYVPRREALIAQADVEGRARAPVGATEEQIGVEIAKRLGELEDEEVNVKKNHAYENSMHAERARMYMKVNMSKKTGTAQVGMFHDSLVNIGVEDGEAQISDAGTEVLGHMDAGKMYAMGRDNMPAKTKDKFMRYVNEVVADRTSPSASNKGILKIEKELHGIIKAKYREMGVLPKAGQIDAEVAEQRNLWLAAGFSILSSTAGPQVVERYIKGRTLDDTRDKLAADIIAFKP